MKHGVIFTAILILFIAATGCSAILESIFASDLSVGIHYPSEYYQKSASITLSGVVYEKESIADYVHVTVSPSGYSGDHDATGGDWSVSITLSEGENTISVYAVGTNGNTGPTATKSYFCDSIKPAITLQKNYNGTVYTNTTSVQFQGTIYEANKIAFFGYECSTGQFSALPKVNGSWSVTITNLIPDTNYIFEMIAEDEIGWQKKTNFTFRVTNTNI